MGRNPNGNKNKHNTELRVAVDIGGTFTDLAAIDPLTGERWFAKSSTTPHDYTEGIVNCLLRLPRSADKFAIFVHGTTLVINACVEKDGARTALITTEGFRDVLEIARGNRTENFNYRFKRHEPFLPREMRLEVPERMNAQGEVVQPLDEERLRSVLDLAKQKGAESVAICFLHSYKNPEHERRAAELASQHHDWFVTASYELSREQREYERTSTVALNAFVGPKVSRYIGALEHMLAERGFRGAFFLMESNGGVADASTARRLPVLLMESGPVGGIAGAMKIGELLGRENLITFDMGGTTAKAALVQHGAVTFDSLYYVGGFAHGYPLQASVVDVVEVGTGGGSLAWIDEIGALHVGPRSAGAFPGPAAYGFGNDQPTVTDANILLGRLDPARFLEGEMKLDASLSKQALEQFGARLGYDAQQMAAGIIQLANLQMSAALRRISIERGKDPRDFTLVAYGGNGPLHATELAEEMGITSILVPPMPAHFSALGMLLADARYDVSQTWTAQLPEDGDRVDGLVEMLNSLREGLTQTVATSIERQTELRFENYAEMRYRGQDQTVKVRLPEDLSTTALKQAYSETYLERYGHVSPIPIQIVSLRVSCYASLGSGGLSGGASDQGAAPYPGTRQRKVFSFKHGSFIPYTVYHRESLNPGWTALAPCLIADRSSTVNVPEGWIARVIESGEIELKRG
jgi:N-methylhydantoinase A